MEITREEQLEEMTDHIMELEDDVELLKKEVARLKSKYEERCWCSVRIPATCGHKALL